MSISKYAKKKALDYAQRVFKIANPKSDVNSGSAIRGLFLLPFSLIYSSIFQDQDIIRNLNLGNYRSIGQSDMNILAGNLLKERPQGSRSATTLRVYLSDIQPFSLDPFPYFQSVVGPRFMPIRPLTFGNADFLEDNGELYVNVPVMSTTYGPSSFAKEGDIQLFNNMPDTVVRVSNVTATIGGDPALSNEEFYSYLKNTMNDGTLAQSNGVRQYITDNYPEVSEVNVIHAGNPLMLRDEIWTVDGINPNLERLGEPFATHTSLGEIDFDYEFGRANGAFSKDLVGKRISIDGDPERFRTVLDVTDNGTAIISGYALEGKADAKIYGEAPSILSMSDVYMYLPSLEIQAKVVDRRENSEALGFNHPSRIYYTEVITYNSGIVVYNEGLDTEARFKFISRGVDANGKYLQIDSDHGVNQIAGDPITAYSMEEVSISVDGDIDNLPVLYVLQVDQLDPFTFETVSTIPQSSPGEYSQPGWYIKNSDSANVFSAKESKFLMLDEKLGKNAFKPLNIVNASVSSENSIVKPGFDFSKMEGKVLDININQVNLTSHPDIDVVAVTVNGDGELVVPGMNVEYMSGTQGRNDINVITYRNGDLVTEYPTSGVSFARDNIISRDSNQFNVNTTHAKIFFGRTTEPAVPLDGQLWWETESALRLRSGGVWIDVSNPLLVYPAIPSRTLETVILFVNTETATITTDNPLVYSVLNGNYVLKGNVTVTSESREGNFASGPIRVTYATNSTISEMQNELDNGRSRLLCDDTLVRSMLPTVIDSEIIFSGESSSEVLYNAFIDLMQEAIREVDRGERIRIDISNIVAAFNEDGLADSMNVNFEIKVTNFLPDGEYQVRYINPSKKTVQPMAVYSAAAPGDQNVTLRRTKSNETLPGRGKVFLGGNNPDTQEIIPYEAVIDKGNDIFELVLRSGWPIKFDHPAWETSYVSVRDYDPDLEFKEGAIFIPANNRPYVRKLVVIKK